MKQKLPIGLQSFAKLREGNFLYVDKTAEIHRLVTEGNYYFLSRPRRFGKSLLLSTIKELFKGRRDLFEGLWIEDQWDWNQRHPVIHIGFSSIGYKTLGLEMALELALDKAAEEAGIELISSAYDQKFSELLEKLSAEKGVVLLIDEYDKPIIDYLDDIPQAKAHQKILKSFYSIIKDSDEYIRLLLITGVSKFSKVSIFSELNNLKDLTIHPKFTTLVGYTQAELEHYFHEGIEKLMLERNLSREEMLGLIQEWYNGYSWDGKHFLYNPFSILSFFDSEEFHNFWFSTGTPTFLVNLLKGRNQIQIGSVLVDQSAFESYDIENLDTLPLLFQTGYSTIKEKQEFGIFLMDYPNREVKTSLLRHLIGSYRHHSAARTTPVVIQLRQAFLDQDLPQIIAIINSLFSSIPSHIFIKEKEAYYHSLVYLVFQYLGQFIEAEVNTATGRIDAVVQTDSQVFVIEFKLDESAETALKQIREKGYADKYLTSGKNVLALGINFSSTEKQVADWKIERY